jgi:hypothetical protein
MDFYIQHLARIKSIFTVVGRIDAANHPSPDAWHDGTAGEAILQWP